MKHVNAYTQDPVVTIDLEWKPEHTHTHTHTHSYTHTHTQNTCTHAYRTLL